MSSDETSIIYINDFSRLASDYLYKASASSYFPEIDEIDTQIGDALLEMEENDHLFNDPWDRTEEFFEAIEAGSEVVVAARMITDNHDYLSDFDNSDKRFFMDFAILTRVSQIEKVLKLEDVREEYFGKDEGELSKAEQLNLLNELSDLQELQGRLREHAPSTQAPERE